MSFLRNTTRALAAVLLLTMGGWASAGELKENTADIKQDIIIPGGMTVTIKRPGGETGCNTANHEKWDTTKGGCSNTEYMKENAQVVSVGSLDPGLSIGVLETTTLTAKVRTRDGQPVGAGVPVTWSTTKGYLSTYSTVTDAASQTSVNLTTPKGTERGIITIAAAAKGGGASAIVALGNSASVTDLTATPPTALADGTSVITMIATVTYYENGKSVGAGESLTWGTKIGRFTYAESVTNLNGQAVAYLVSNEPGTAFVSAAKEVAFLKQVTFTPPAPVGPVINSFSMMGKAAFSGKGNKYYTDNLAVFDMDMAYWQDNLFSWSATGADRYEIVDQYGIVHYSGTDSSWHVVYQEIEGNGFGSQLFNHRGKVGLSNDEVFILKAYKGSNVTTKQITVQTYWYSCQGGCSS